MRVLSFLERRRGRSEAHICGQTRSNTVIGELRVFPARPDVFLHDTTQSQGPSFSSRSTYQIINRLSMPDLSFISPVLPFSASGTDKSNPDHRPAFKECQGRSALEMEPMMRVGRKKDAPRCNKRWLTNRRLPADSRTVIPSHQ